MLKDLSSIADLRSVCNGRIFGKPRKVLAFAPALRIILPFLSGNHAGQFGLGGGMADASDLKSDGRNGRMGSTPIPGTHTIIMVDGKADFFQQRLFWATARFNSSKWNPDTGCRARMAVNPVNSRITISAIK